MRLWTASTPVPARWLRHNPVAQFRLATTQVGKNRVNVVSKRRSQFVPSLSDGGNDRIIIHRHYPQTDLRGVQLIRRGAVFHFAMALRAAWLTAIAVAASLGLRGGREALSPGLRPGLSSYAPLVRGRARPCGPLRCSRLRGEHGGTEAISPPRRKGRKASGLATNGFAIPHDASPCRRRTFDPRPFA
jgi:hypothetical protein